MEIAIERIKEMFITPREITVTDIESFMINIRLVIESNRLQEQYKILNLYSNWSVHSSINDSITAHRILEFITNAFIAHNIDPQNSKWYNDSVLEALQFHKLQYEIVDFGYRFSINLTLFNEDYFWRIFGQGLIDLLQQRPLNLNENRERLKNIRNSIIQKALSANQDYSAVTSLKFTYLDGKQHYEITIGVNKINKVLGPIYFVSQEDFNKASGRI